MAELSGFFDAHLVDGEYDRVYLSEHFAKYFASFIGNGIFGGKSNELQVLEKETASMGIRVLSGQAWIDGYWYENTDELHLAMDIADGVLNRIDSAVVRWNHSERTIRVAVRKGTAAVTPVAPAVQRDNDYYELKLADIYVKAGATRITQANITDKRYHTDECGLVIGIVQQLDAEEFGIQLDAYIQEFIAEHNTWKNATQADIEQWVSNFKTSCTNWFNQFKTDSNASVNNLLSSSQTRIDKLVSDGQTSINNVVSTGTTNINNVVTKGQTDIAKVVTDGTVAINKLLSDKESEANALITESQGRFDSVIGNLERIAQENDVASIVLDVNSLKNEDTAIKKDIAALKVKVEEPNGMGIEDEVEVGCYYVETSGGVKEWINPPNRPGVEYRTTERWNGKAVYTQMLYLGALSNKLAMAVTIQAEYDKVFFVSGYAFDPENNMSYPFPIILNGLTPIAVISGVEGNGYESNIIINVNEDLSAFSGYINIKYVK